MCVGLESRPSSPDSLGLNPGATTYCLRDCGQITQLLSSLVHACVDGDNDSTYLTESLGGLQENSREAPGRAHHIW